MARGSHPFSSNPFLFDRRSCWCDFESTPHAHEWHHPIARHFVTPAQLFPRGSGIGHFPIQVRARSIARTAAGHIPPVGPIWVHQMGGPLPGYGLALLGGGMAAWAPPPDPPPHPHQIIFPPEKIKSIKWARNWRSILGTQTCFSL